MTNTEPPNHSTLNHNALDIALAFFRERSAPYPSPFAPETAKEFLQVYLAAAQPSPDRSQRRAAALDAFYGLLGTPATGDAGDDLDVILAAYDGPGAPSEPSVIKDERYKRGYDDGYDAARCESSVICEKQLQGVKSNDSIGSPMKYSDGSYSREYDEQSVPNEISDAAMIEHFDRVLRMYHAGMARSYAGEIFRELKPYLATREPVFKKVQADE